MLNNTLNSLSNSELESIIEASVKEWFRRSMNRDVGRSILYDGTVVSLLDFKPEDFNPEHCFNILPNINRYNGNTYIPFSVGQHSLLAYEIGKMIFPPESFVEHFCFLIHDFPEGIVGDCISPIKHLFPLIGFRLIEEVIEDGMVESLGLKEFWTPQMHEKIKLVDKIALTIEVYNLNKYFTSSSWGNYIFSIAEVKQIFRNNFSEYSHSIIDSILNLQPRQVEVRLRNSFNNLIQKWKPKN